MNRVIREYVYMKAHTGYVVQPPQTDNQGALGMYGDLSAYCKLSLPPVLCMLTSEHMKYVYKKGQKRIFLVWFVYFCCNNSLRMAYRYRNIVRV